MQNGKLEGPVPLALTTGPSNTPSPGAKIKICGLCREEDVSFANEALPDFVGFVFAPSRRQVSYAQAARFRERLKAPILPVGVFVNVACEDIQRLYADGVIALAQLHGTEDAAYRDALKACCPVPVIQAIRMEGPLLPERLASLRAEYLLLDSGGGGTGRPFQWELLRSAPILRPYFLAGGITWDNLDAALGYGPYGIDVSSGAETQGRKDRDKMIRLVQRVRDQDEKVRKALGR
ncbi:MAG: phosphoribosylanthranilate isomerase [Spirochaetaceae bacterium]|nr:phosphoribosylanthranilate isomerase [Spirochaetaceae bacterium]